MKTSTARCLLSLRQLTKQSPRIRGVGKIIPPIAAAGYRVPEPLHVQTVHDVDGDLTMELALEDLIQSYIFWSPCGYDRHAVTIVKRYVKPGQVFVDLGANVGYYTLIAAKLVGPKGTVIAVEADPDNYAALKRNIAHNRFEQVVAVGKGVADQRGVLQFDRSEKRNRGAHTFAGATLSTGIDVEVDTLDGILHEVGADRVDFMKIDIQGFEVRVLRDTAVFRYRPVILTEVASDELALAGSSKREYLDLLRSHNYTASPISRDQLNYLCLPMERQDPQTRI
jgi:FkbM family methyltransferase